MSCSNNTTTWAPSSPSARDFTTTSRLRQGFARRVVQMHLVGSAGDPPAPVGDPPTGTALAREAKGASRSRAKVSLTPSGGSPDGTGQWPVPPASPALVFALSDPAWVGPAKGSAVRNAMTVGVAGKHPPLPVFPSFSSTSSLLVSSLPDE